MFYTFLDAELLVIPENNYFKAWKCTRGFLGTFQHLDKGVVALQTFRLLKWT